MKTSDFYFDLPKELIAQDPLTDRASSRLLKLDRYSGEIEHRTFSDVTDYLRESDLLILNNTKVIPARLLRKTQVQMLRFSYLKDILWMCGRLW